MVIKNEADTAKLVAEHFSNMHAYSKDPSQSLLLSPNHVIGQLMVAT